jgi:hypothetical protein
MNEKQALEVIKQVLDLATAKGIFATLNDTSVVIEAYNVISKKISNENMADAN